jgi:hypothetical protein
MAINLLRPRVGKLFFQLYGRFVHPEFFDVLAERKIRHENYELRLWITRTGHAITWRQGGLCLCEVTTEADQELPEQGRLLRYRIRGEQSDRLSYAGGIDYQMSFQVETLQPDVFLHFHDELLADRSKTSLLCNFQPNHRLSLAPLGLLTAQGRPGCLILNSFHTFPEEYAVLKSQSLIERSK